MVKFCKNCGTQLEENVNFCPNCGQTAEREQQSRQQKSAPKKKNNRLRVILPVAGSALAVIALIVILVVRPFDNAAKEVSLNDRAAEDVASTETDTPVTRKMNYPAYTAKDGTWAIYIYICGSDLESDDPTDESDGFGLATLDLGEIVAAKLPDNVNIIMETGGAMNWANELDPKVLSRFRHGADGTVELESAPLASMGDPNTLVDFLTFCNTNYPAEHQVVILWNHGGGSLFGYAADENFKGDSLSLPELTAAFDAAPAASGNYEIIGFDACLMATVDVVAALKDFGNYLVASEELEPGVGWNYTGALNALVADTSQTAYDFARAICDSYYQGLLDFHNYNDKLNFHQSATLSVIDLGKAGNLLNAYKAMADEVLLAAVGQKEEYLSRFGRAARESENYGGNTDEDGYYEMVDLGDLAENAADLLPESAAKVKAALKDCVVYQVKGPLRPKASGLSCYYCYSGSPKSVEFYAEAGGDKAVGYYHEYSLNGSLTQEGLQYVSSLETPDNEPAPEVEELPHTSELGLDGYPVTLGADGYWRLELGAERAKSVAAVRNYMLLDLGGGVQVLFGVSNEIKSDWNSGVFTEQYSGLWGCIDDAQVFMRAMASGENYILYSAPILLNGVRHSLFVSLETDSSGGEVYTILGIKRAPEDAAKSLADKLLAAKNMSQLQEGDIIEPLHYFLIREDDGSWRKDAFAVQSITIGDTPRFYEKSLGDGHFQIMFCMVDYAGNEYLSQPGDFKVRNGEIERVQGWEVYPQPSGSYLAWFLTKDNDSFNPQAQSPYYRASLDAEVYTAARKSLGLPYPDAGDQMTDNGGYSVEIFTNDPAINLDDFTAERIVYMTGRFIDGRDTRQRDIAFEVTGIMTGAGGVGGSKIAGSFDGAVMSESDRYTLGLAKQTLELIKNKDWGALWHIVHPEQGLTFSPYGYVDTDTAVRLGAGDVAALGMDDVVRTWGYFDGSGVLMEYTFDEYYDRFIMSQDFTQAPEVAINQIIRSNFENNLYVFGNGCVYAEFHIPGNERNPDYSWASLRLVFAGYGGELYLVGIVHDEWTV